MNGLNVLVFWYRSQLYAIESRSPAEGAYAEGFIKAKFTQVGVGWVCWLGLEARTGVARGYRHACVRSSVLVAVEGCAWGACLKVLVLRSNGCLLATSAVHERLTGTRQGANGCKLLPL